jgi:hypothetical protein
MHMSGGYFVSRQHYWGADPEDAHVVEIAGGGLDYANPDMLSPRYAGEGETYEDPREAAAVALEICKAWRGDGRTDAKVAYGYTGGYTLPFEPVSEQELMAWAEKEYRDLPKCDRCGAMRDPDKSWWHGADPDLRYCSQYCAEEDYWRICRDREDPAED